MNNANVYVVVPCYNEAQVIRSTLIGLLDQQYAVILVDDGSTDDTIEQISDLEIHYLQHVFNMGQGAALQTGMSYALSQKNMEYVVHFDADGQHAVDDIKRLVLLNKENRIDVVLGSRFMKNEDLEKVPKMRRFVLKIGRMINWFFFKVKLTDAHNGFRVLSRKAVESIDLKENGSAHASEILGTIKQAGLSFMEAPVTINYTEYSKLKGQSSWAGLNILIDIILRKII